MKKKLNLIILIALAGASGSTPVSNGQEQRSHALNPTVEISSSSVNTSGKTQFQPSNAERRYLPDPALFNTADNLLSTFTIRTRAIRNIDSSMLTALRQELSQTWEVVIDSSGETQTLAGSVLADQSDTSFPTLSPDNASFIGAIWPMLTNDSSDIHRTVRVAFKFGVVRAGKFKLHIGSGSAAASPSSTPTPPSTPTPTPAPGCAVFTVKDSDDAGDASPGDGVCATAGAGCTLRAAIQEANAFSCGGTIDIVFNLSTPNTISLNSALPDINRNVNLNGPGANLLTVQRSAAGGTPNFRIFSINSGKTVAILGMTITNGRAPDGTPGTGRTPAGPGGDGGGVLNHGELTLRDVVIAGNRAGDGGAGDSSANLSGGSGGRGGGIYSEGNLTSDFFIFANGSLTIQGVMVSNNVAGNGGAGPSVGSPGDGGGIAWSGTTFTMSDCKVTNNSAGRDAGGMFLQPGTAGTVNLSNVSVIANNAGGSGGGINFLGLHEGVETMTNCTVSGNGSGSQGGGIANDGALIIFASTISNNFTQAANSRGGGIMNGASVAMTDSTVSGNHTNPNTGLGGGIYNYKATLAVNNSTITGNSAYTSGAVDSGQGIANNGYATGPLVPKIANTIIAGNGNGSVPEVTGYFISQGYNLIGRATVGNGGGFNGDESGFINGSNGDQVGSLQSPINALLGLLVNNGGPTQTHILLPGSPAINAGDPAFVPSSLTTDQRGFPRVAGGRIDIGAVEVSYAIGAIAGTPQSTQVNTSFATPMQAMVTESGNPVSGATVTFTAPASGPSGTFTGSLTTATAQTNANGLATAPTFTANGIDGGPYNVVASLAAGLPSASFALINTSSTKANQTIIFNALANKTFGDADFNVSATASSGLLVSFTATGNCSISGNTAHLTGAGSCTITASQAGNANFNAAANVLQSFTIAKANQTFTFGALTNKTFGDPDFSVSATASSGLTVSFTATGNCSISGNTVHLTGAGSCTITASQAGNANFNAAPNVPQSFTISKGNQTITFGALANKTFGDADFNVSATATSGLTVSFSAGGDCTVSGNTVHLTGAGSCTVSASQAGNANFNTALSVPRSFPIAKAATTTSLTSPLNPSALGQSVTFTATVNPAPNTATPTGTIQFKDGGVNLGAPVSLNASGVAQLTTSTLTVGTHAITAEYSGNSDFDPSTGSLSQVVNSRTLLKFSQSTYSVNESGKIITITVIRSGDTVPAVTVDYASPDDSAATIFLPCSTIGGIASPRCDFTTVIGTLRFASGEISKTFDVLISQDTYLEGPETFLLTLTNPTGGAGFAQPSDANATVTIDDDDSGNIVGELSVTESNPIDDNQNFVRQHYHDFLNREPDEPGLNFWTSQIANCGANQACIDAARVSVSASFFLSIEFQQTGYYVERTYKSGFGDIAPPTIPVPIRFIDFLRDTQEVGRGVVVGQGPWQAQLDANKRAFALAFVQRPDFLTRYPASTSAQGFVTALNANAGNILTPSEQLALITSLSTNPADAMLRANVLFQVAENQTLQQQESNRAFVLMEYFGYLRRNPDAAPDSDFAGFNFWLTKLNQFNGNYLNAEMVKAFLTSTEYRQRFGP